MDRQTTLLKAHVQTPIDFVLDLHKFGALCLKLLFPQMLNKLLKAYDITQLLEDIESKGMQFLLRAVVKLGCYSVD